MQARYQNINISSDDNDSSSEDLPVVGFAATLSKKKSSRFHRPVIEATDCLENIDLTQQDAGFQDEAIELSGSSTKSLEWDKDVVTAEKTGKTEKLRANSTHSDSMIELDSDAIFDEMFLPPAELKTAVSGSSVVSAVSEASGSSGYESGGRRKRKKTIGNTEDVQLKKKTGSLEKVTKKRHLAEEKLARQAAAEMNKIYKPGECLKYMSIELHPSLRSAWYMSDLSREAGPCRVSEDPAVCHPGLVLWSRRGPQRLGSGDVLELTNAKQPCDRALLVQTAEEIAPYVAEHKLASHVAEIQAMAGCQLTLVVFGVRDYFKKSGRKKPHNVKLITEIELEMAFTDLLVSADCDSVVVQSPNELAILITQFTRAIAEAPHKRAKRACDEQADFYMRGENKKCVAVDKDGHGLSRLWQQMIAVLHLSSLETSRTLCAHYKSPLQLFEALQESDVINELADLGVDRAGLPGAKYRRLGPEFARKLKILFTSNDGDLLID